LELPKQTFTADEPIRVALTIRNGSSRPFQIDSRKHSPVYTIRDEKGRVVLTLAKEEKVAPPALEDLTTLKPGDTFQPQSTEPFTLSKPGKYTIEARYAFLPSVEDKPDVWVGTVKNSFVTRLEIVEE
jgi:hypothetical protein